MMNEFNKSPSQDLMHPHMGDQISESNVTPKLQTIYCRIKIIVSKFHASIIIKTESLLSFCEFFWFHCYFWIGTGIHSWSVMK